MKRKNKMLNKILVIFVFTVSFPGFGFCEYNAYDLVKGAFDQMRGNTSKSKMEMKIVRPDYTRTMVLKGWTKGEDLGLFYSIAPAKDKGNATLKKKEKMWTYNPKINRVIKLPPSMMSQSWMGSDFSNNDLSKTDSIIHDYNHQIIGQENKDKFIIYEIKSIPKKDAPVVWGMQKLKIRNDMVMLEQVFFDQNMVEVKKMRTENIERYGKRLFPKLWIMENSEEQGRYTRVEYLEHEFDVELKPNLFSITSLKGLR